MAGTITLAELLDISKKKNSISLADLGPVITDALANPLVQAVPPLVAGLTAILAGITAVEVAKTAANTVKTLIPTLKKATTGGSIPLNPPAAADLAGGIAEGALSGVVGGIESAARNAAIDLIFNTPIPIP